MIRNYPIFKLFNSSSVKLAWRTILRKSSRISFLWRIATAMARDSESMRLGSDKVDSLGKGFLFIIHIYRFERTPSFNFLHAIAGRGFLTLYPVCDLPLTQGKSSSISFLVSVAKGTVDNSFNKDRLFIAAL